MKYLQLYARKKKPEKVKKEEEEEEGAKRSRKWHVVNAVYNPRSDIIISSTDLTASSTEKA